MRRLASLAASLLAPPSSRAPRVAVGAFSHPSARSRAPARVAPRLARLLASDAARAPRRARSSRARLAAKVWYPESERINADVQRARDVERVLAVVDANANRLGPVNVSAALSRIQALATSAASAGPSAPNPPPGALDADPRFATLLAEARRFARSGESNEQSWANSMHALAKLRACGAIASRANATLDRAWSALVDHLPRVASELRPRHASIALWALAKSGARARGPDADPTLVRSVRTLWRAATTSAHGPRPGPQNLANAAWAAATMGVALGADEWRAFDDAARVFGEGSSEEKRGNDVIRGDVSARLAPQNVSNALWALAKLRMLGPTHDPPSGSRGDPSGPSCATLKTLARAATATAPAMSSHESSNALYAYAASAGAWPFPAETRDALERAASRTIRRANAQEAANVAWYLAKMETYERGGAAEWRRSGAFSASPSESSAKMARERGGASRRRVSLRAAALARLEHLAPRASLVEIAMAFWSHALLGEAPSGSLRAALEARLTTLVAREGAGVADPGAHKQNLSNLVWAYAKSRARPSEAAWRALDLLADRTVKAFGTKDLCLAAWGYAALGRRPRSDATWARFNDALETHADAFEPDELASAAWARAAIRACDPSEPDVRFDERAWRRLAGLNAGDFERTESLLVAYHAWRVGRELLPPTGDDSFDERRRSPRDSNKENEHPAESDPESFPFLAAARDAWRAQRQAQSASQRLVGDALTRLGVAHVPEHDFDADQATDFFLPAHDVAVEFDGPTHFYADERVPDARTRLRNLFLARRCRAIAALPYWGLEAARAEGGDDAVDRWVAREIERQTGADVRGNPNPAGGGRFEGRVRGIDYAPVDALIVDGFEDAAARWTRALPARRAADLERRMRAASDDAERRGVLVADAEADATRKRAALREEVMRAASATKAGGA